MNGSGVRNASPAIAVCGLGTLGQYCVYYLKTFGVPVHATEIAERPTWELAGFPEMMDTLVAGDCRDPKVLERLKLRECRAILILTKDERVNIATAFAARAINPKIRILVRSSQENLNDLVGRHLGDFVAIEPTQISAPAFALAALGEETLGLFELRGRLVRVSQVRVASTNLRAFHRELHELDGHGTRLLIHARAGDTSPLAFRTWDPDARVEENDLITSVDVDISTGLVSERPSPVANLFGNAFKPQRWMERWRASRDLWSGGTQTQRVALTCAVIIPALYLLGVLLYKHQYKEISWHDALNVSMVLILGGYDNLFGSLKLPFPIPGWLHIFSVALTVAGTLFVGIVYAFLTERVLSTRFVFRKRRPAAPLRGHIVLVGLGRVGKQVAGLLQALHQPLAGVDLTELEPGTLPGLPFHAGSPVATLDRVNVERARCLMVLTNDEVANLEIALAARACNPQCELVIRTDDPYFSANITELVPHAHALGVNAIAGEAFAAAAFGETILSLFRINGETVLVTEYVVEEGDTLAGRVLADAAYGYGLVPLVYEAYAAGGGERVPAFLPSGELRLTPGDRLVVLATILGLQRVEQGDIGRPNWKVAVERAPSTGATFDGAMTIARVSGCDVTVAQSLMATLPGILETPLHQHQALSLVRQLAAVRVESRAFAAEDPATANTAQSILTTPH